MAAQAFHGQKELFKSEHCDWCFASTIESKCRVHSLQAYQVLHALTLSGHHIAKLALFLYGPATLMLRAVSQYLCSCRHSRMLEQMTSLQDSHTG